MNYQQLQTKTYQTNYNLKPAANRVDCPAQNGQGEPLTPPSIRVTYLAVRKEMG